MSTTSYYLPSSSATEFFTNNKRCIVLCFILFLLALLFSFIIINGNKGDANSCASFSPVRKHQNKVDSDALDSYYASILQLQKQNSEEYPLIHGGDNEQEAAENERAERERDGDLNWKRKLESNPQQSALEIPELSEKNTVPQHPSLTDQLIYPDDKELFKSIRQENGRFLLPLPNSCAIPYANKTQQISFSPLHPSCSSSSSSKSSSCCCCCWSPDPATCAGNFREMNVGVFKTRISEKVGFVSKNLPAEVLFATPDDKEKFGEKVKLYDSACPWFDFGRWARPLPENFVELSSEDVEDMDICNCPGRKNSNNKLNNNNKQYKIGFSFLHDLASLTYRLRPQPPTTPFSPTFNMSEFFPQMTNDQKRDFLFSKRTSSPNAPGGIFVIAGDSMTRNIFTRLLHRIRSRECSGEAEFRRKAVFEIQSHDTIAYVATTHGDGMTLTRSCEAGLDFLTHYGIQGQAHRHQNEKILFQACFVWDNTHSALHATVANLNQLKSRVATLIFFPQIWYCAFKLSPNKARLCQTAEQVVGSALNVIGAATTHSIPRVVVTTNVVRQKFPYYQLERIRQRNKMLKELFPLQPFGPQYQWIRSMFSTNTNNKNNLTTQSNNNEANNNNNNDSRFSNIRMYDFSSRHDVLWPEACDNLHSMCMLLPNRDRYEVMVEDRKRNLKNNKKKRSYFRGNESSSSSIGGKNDDDYDIHKILSYADHQIDRFFGNEKCPAPMAIVPLSPSSVKGKKKISKSILEIKAVQSEGKRYSGNGLCQDLSNVILFDEILTALKIS